MYADAIKKLKDEARETAKPKTKTGKSGTGPDFVLEDGHVRPRACASQTLLATVVASSSGGVNASYVATLVFVLIPDSAPQVAVPTPPDVATLVSALAPDSEADPDLFGGCATASKTLRRRCRLLLLV